MTSSEEGGTKGVMYWHLAFLTLYTDVNPRPAQELPPVTQRGQHSPNLGRESTKALARGKPLARSLIKDV